jgi:hypothetical protein
MIQYNGFESFARRLLGFGDTVSIAPASAGNDGRSTECE